MKRDSDYALIYVFYVICNSGRIIGIGKEEKIKKHI